MSEEEQQPRVLDASALLAWLREEPGAEVVEERLSGSFVSAVNLSEVLQKSLAGGVEISGVVEDLVALGVSFVAFGAEQAIVAAEMSILLCVPAAKTRLQGQESSGDPERDLAAGPPPEAPNLYDAALALNACVPDDRKVEKDALLADAAREPGHSGLTRKLKTALNKALNVEHNAGRLKTDWQRVWRPKKK